MNYLTTSKVLAYLAIIFIAGAATGAAFTMRHAREPQTQAPSMDKACSRFQDRLVSKLGLSPEQVLRLEPVFEETSQELRAVHIRAIRDTDAIVCQAHRRIATELNAEQKVKLETYNHERRQWLDHCLKDKSKAQ